MRKKIKELYEHSTLVAKIRYSYLCLLVPFVLFLIFCFYNLWNNNRRYEDMINSSVMASQFSLDFQKDFDYETYLLIVGNKTLEESSLHDMLVEADGIVAGLEELTESQENLKRLTSVKKYLNNLETYIGRIEDNIREGNRYEDNMEIWENDVQIVTSLVGDTISQYIYYEIRGIQESRQQYQDFFVNMIRFSIIAFALILILFLFLSYYIPLSITSPIRRLTQVTDQVAKGDLTVRSDVTGGVEAQVLSDSLNTMIDKINELLEQILKRLKPIAEKQNIELVLESFRPVSADVDEVKITLAFTNLIENAVKYNRPDGWVHVSLNADHQYFYLKVEDCGIGIPEESLEHIYERFYRVDKSHSREIGGTGLGLAITRSAVLMHRGAIKVFSTVGEGTIFNVRIPLNYIS